MSFPALDVAGFTRRSILPDEYIAFVETKYPGFIAGRIAKWTDRVYAQLAKRYGSNGRADSLPFGARAPDVTASGTAPPGVTLSGRPTLGSLGIVLQVTTPGPLGTALFRWSTDAGKTWVATGVVTAPAVVLGATGLTALFPPGAYGVDNLYSAPTPVPETILGWLVELLNLDVLRKRGVNADDPQVVLLVEEAKRALDELAQAANSQTGLFDLPTSAGEGSAITSTGPLFYTEASPFVAADRQQLEGFYEDQCGSGSYGPGGY